MRKNIMHEDIQAIATIISETNLAGIDRRLRETAILLRDPTQASAIDSNKLKLAQLEIARAFIQKHPALTPDWRISILCFQELYDFFIEAKEIENHQTMAMFCWYLLLKRVIYGAVPAQKLIVLGEAFFDEPTKFAAFLYWLLSNHVDPRDIVDSNILHRYFALHVINMEELQKTFQLLSKCGNSTEGFLNFISSVSCECSGLIDYREESGGFRSYNLMGTYFQHTYHAGAFSRSSIDQHPLIDTENVLSQGAHFFHLFGWKFLMSINNIWSEKYREIIYQLIDSSSSALFLNEFPIKVLSGELDRDITTSILQVFRAWNEEVEQYDAYLIKLNPFYLHTITLPASPNECVRGALKQLSSEKRFQAIYHLSYLSALCIKLESMEAYQIEYNALLKTIFDFIFPIGNSLGDSVIQKIYDILPQMKVYFESAVTQFTQEVFARIEDFLNNRCDYDAVELMWGSYLTHFNFSKYLYPDLAEKTSYPPSKFHLKTHALECFFKYYEDQQIPFSAIELSKKICDNDDQRLRTLQEAVCITKNDQLINHIIDQMLQCNNDFSARFFHSSFGVNNSIIQHAFDHFSETKLLSFLKEIQYTEDQFFNTCALAVYKNNGVVFFNLIESELFTPEISLKCIHAILENSMFSLLHEFTLAKLMDSPSLNLASRTFIYDLFIVAIKQGRNDIVRFFAQKEKSQLLVESAIKAGAKCAAENCHYETLLYLCGFSDEIENTIIQKNNISLLVEMISTYEAQMLSSPYDFKAMLTYKNENNENLLHLIVNNRSLDMLKTYVDLLKKTLNQNEISDLLSSRSAFGFLPYCELVREENTPNARQINDYLNQMRDEYTPQLHPTNLFATPKPRGKASKRGREEAEFDHDSLLALLNL